jgi:hypothetical protein
MTTQVAQQVALSPEEPSKNSPVEDKLKGALWGTVCGVVTLALLVASMVLVKRLEKCAPAETENETNERKAIMWLSGLAIVLMVGRTVLVGYNPNSKLYNVMDMTYHAFVLIVACVNLSYLSSVKTETCSSMSNAPTGATNGADVLANKNLVLFVMILSGMFLLLAVKKLAWKGAHWWATRKSK